MGIWSELIMMDSNSKHHVVSKNVGHLSCVFFDYYM